MLNISEYYIDNDLRIDRTDTKNGIGGGLLVYIRNDVIVKADLSPCNFNQVCQFSIVQQSNVMPVNISLVYRSPNSSSDNDNELINVLDKTKPGSNIFGDFNLPKTNFSVATSDMKGRPFLEVVGNRFLDQLIDFPTHNKGGILDLFFSNMSDNVLSVEDIGNLGNSDHCILKAELDVSMQFNDTKELIRDWKRGDQEGLVECIKNINFPGIFQGKDAGQQWDTLKEVTDIALDRYIPLTSRRKPGQPPWLSQAVIRITRKKNRYWKRFAKNRTVDNFDRYKVVEKLCKRSVQQAKKRFEKKIADSGNKRPFNSYVKSKTKTKHNVGPLKVNNVLVTENEDMAKELNTFFSSVFTREAPGPLPHCPKLPSHSILEDMWIDSDTVKKKILKLKPSSAPGPDKMTARFLIMNVEALAPALAIIYNESLQTGVVPEDWRRANVTPIFKKGSKANPGNYRPVSLTSIPCKVMESCIKDAITDHLVNNQLIRDSQHGFMQHKSTTTNLLEFLETMTSEQDQGRPMDVIYLDFAKAFDKVPHRRLLAKFKAHSIQGKVLDWIENWLADRKQRTVLNGAESDWSDVGSGVPQGSVLGPLAFIVFINDIDLVCNFIKLMNKFADDTKAANTILTDKDAEDLQDCLHRLVTWADTWGMEFNVTKCKVMHVGRNNPRSEYSMSGTRLTTTEAERDIGVMVHHSLRPSTQCSEASRKANVVLGQISRSFHFRDRFTFVKLYKQYVRPHLEFSVPAWSPWTQGDKETLEKIQRRAVRMISGLQGKTYEDRLRELDMLTLEGRRVMYDLVQTFKIIRGFDDVKCSTWFTLVGDNPNRVTRQTSDPLNIVRPHCRNEIRRSFFSVRVVDSWNSLSSEVKHARSIASFKRQVRDLIKNNILMPGPGY